MRTSYNGIGFDSQLECNNYRLLEKLGANFEYNSKDCEFNYEKLIKDGICRHCGSDHVASKHLYTCDFKVVTFGTGKTIYIETKGNGYCFTSETRSKHILLKKQFPEMDLRFVFSNWNTKIGKSAKSTNREWAERYGFICANRWIPKEWLNE